MKKIICDFCKLENNDTTKYILPSREPAEVRGGIGDSLLFKYEYTTQDVKKDVCPECREKIARLLGLVKNVNIKDTDDITMSFTFE